MRQASQVITLETRGRGLTDFTSEASRFLDTTGIANGLMTLFCRHTSASLVIQENADPEVQADLDRFLSRLVPDGDPLYAHVLEGADDMPAHVRAALTQTSLGVPVIGGALALGTWQGLYLFEHRRAPHRRQVVLHLLGE